METIATTRWEKSLAKLIDEGKLLHLGPHFPTFIRQNSASTPDMIFSNKHHYLNIYSEAGNITSSDHLPIILRLSTSPIYVKQEEKIITKKANWTVFKNTLDNNMKNNSLDNLTITEIENEVQAWLVNVKQAMRAGIPRSKHRKIVQMKTNSQIKRLETMYRTLKDQASIYGLTLEQYREQTRIRLNLKVKCKEETNKRWEDKLKNIIKNGKNTDILGKNKSIKREKYHTCELPKR